MLLGIDIKLGVDVGSNALPSPSEKNSSLNIITAVGLGFRN